MAEADAGLSFEIARRDDGFALEAALTVGEGETVALVGPSGAGKSTCLAIVAGLLRPDSGRVVCGGEVWCDVADGIHRPPEQRRTGMLFQEFALFPHRSVGDNVRYGSRARGRSRQDAGRSAAKWLERLGLAHLADRPVGSVSGGERQRVALARALASEPRVLLLDEPFGALDVTTRGSVRAELRRFLAECGLATLLVTHDPVDALALGERVAVMEEGRLIQAGPREELLAHPRTSFVADLAGLNLFRAELAGGTGLKEARVGPVVFHVLADGRSGESFLAFAPSEVALSAEASRGSPQNVFAGVVVDVLPLADRLRVVLDAGVRLVAEVTREAASALSLRVGASASASIKATAIRVYH
jgi:molybdate transport system ATP-binding protein